MQVPFRALGVAALVWSGGCRDVLGVEELQLGYGGADGGGGTAASAGTAGSGGMSGVDPAVGPSSAPRQSCDLLLRDCGATADANCCATVLIPGGTFNRINDPNAPASVGEFQLDKFEATLARFRAFHRSGYGTQAHPPSAGAGAHPALPASGWDSAYDAQLPANSAALEALLECNPTFQVWSEEPGERERVPMNCIDWYVAFAFCIWDGGRLATEAEWNFAASGGGEQRPYPWGSQEPDGTRASYQCLADGSPECSLADLLEVGALPAGDGKWGNSDLGGGLYEWTLDSYGALPPSCADCSNLGSSPNRVIRGGSFINGVGTLSTTHREAVAPDVSPNNVGVRCARAL